MIFFLNYNFLIYHPIFSFQNYFICNRFAEIYTCTFITILPVLDFTIFPSLYYHGVLCHQRKKDEVNHEELHVYLSHVSFKAECHMLCCVVFMNNYIYMYIYVQMACDTLINYLLTDLLTIFEKKLEWNSCILLRIPEYYRTCFCSFAINEYNRSILLWRHFSVRIIIIHIWYIYA